MLDKNRFPNASHFLAVVHAFIEADEKEALLGLMQQYLQDSFSTSSEIAVCAFTEACIGKMTGQLDRPVAGFFDEAMNKEKDKKEEVKIGLLKAKAFDLLERKKESIDVYEELYKSHPKDYHVAVGLVSANS